MSKKRKSASGGKKSTQKKQKTTYAFIRDWEDETLTRQPDWPESIPFLLLDKPPKIKVTFSISKKVVVTGNKEKIIKVKHNWSCFSKRILAKEKKKDPIVLIDAKLHGGQWRINKWLIIRPVDLESIIAKREEEKKQGIYQAEDKNPKKSNYIVTVLQCQMCRAMKTCSECLKYESMPMRGPLEHYRSLQTLLPNCCLVEFL